MNGSSLVDRIQLSPNHEPRADGKKPRFLILHYTGMVSGKAAADWLCTEASRVSCHYLVDDTGEVVQMVDEVRRAWHAGVSSWQGETDINSASIGIEIQNEGHSAGLKPFPAVQMARVAALNRDIMLRNGIAPENVLAHSDIAPGRKIDPGEAFDWNLLAEQGVGISVIPSTTTDDVPDISTLQKTFAKLGYGIDITGVFDNRTKIVTEALQRHHRRKRVDGIVDAETWDVLRRLAAL